MKTLIDEYDLRIMLEYLDEMRLYGYSDSTLVTKKSLLNSFSRYSGRTLSRCTKQNVQDFYKQKRTSEKYGKFIIKTLYEFYAHGTKQKKKKKNPALMIYKSVYKVIETEDTGQSMINLKNANSETVILLRDSIILQAAMDFLNLKGKAHRTSEEEKDFQSAKRFFENDCNGLIIEDNIDGKQMLDMLRKKKKLHGKDWKNYKYE